VDTGEMLVLPLSSLPLMLAEVVSESAVRTEGTAVLLLPSELYPEESRWAMAGIRGMLGAATRP
jgi:hypothetical protein